MEYNLFKSILEKHPINLIRLKAIEEKDGDALYKFWYTLIETIVELLPVYSNNYNGYFLGVEESSFISLRHVSILIVHDSIKEEWCELEKLYSTPAQAFYDAVNRIEPKLISILDSVFKHMSIFNEPVTKETLLKLPEGNYFDTYAKEMLHGDETERKIYLALSLVKIPVGDKEFFFYKKGDSFITKGKEFLKCYMESIDSLHQRTNKVI